MLSQTHSIHWISHVKGVFLHTKYVCVLFALKKQCSVTAVSRPKVNEHLLDAPPAKVQRPT